MGENAELDTWWARLADKQRQHLKAASERLELDADTMKLLGSTACPNAIAQTQVWEGNPQAGLIWIPDLREFIRAQS